MIFMDIHWQQQIDDLIIRRVTLQEICNLLKNIKESGVHQKEVVDHLNEMRTEKLTEATDDFVLEVLDVATGFCNERYRVW